MRRCRFGGLFAVGRTRDDIEFPHLHDVTTMIELLACLGVGVTLNENMQVEVTAKNLTSFRAPYELVKTMRASFLVLGPLLARFGEAEVSCLVAVPLALGLWISI